MPVSPLPACAKYVHPPHTKENLEFAELPTIDLLQAQTPEGRAALYPQVRDAFRTHGFIYAINHGYTQTQTDRIFDIADLPFTVVSPDEMNNFVVDVKKEGHFQGYKRRGFWACNPPSPCNSTQQNFAQKLNRETGARDRVELYSLSMDVKRRSHPHGLQPFLPELDAFARHNHFNILNPMLRLLALSLGLDEETLVEMHKFAGAGQTATSFMKYYSGTQEEEEKARNVWLNEHTDFGTLSILWSQPAAGLQILSPDGKWRWIRHIDNALVINTGDALDLLSGGFFKATIHRVVQPPEDQRQYSRLCVFYFAYTDDATRLVPLTESSILQKSGIKRQDGDILVHTMESWRKFRSRPLKDQK